MTQAAVLPFSKLAVRMRELNALTSDPAMPDHASMIDELLRRRTEIATAKPKTDLDALSMLIMAESAADALMRADIHELQQEGIRRLGAELLSIVWTLSKSFEHKSALRPLTLACVARSKRIER